MKGKELYDYYLSLGYDHKVATSLAQFTYGDYRFSEFSMDDLYEALCKGREYLPPEELEEAEKHPDEKDLLSAKNWALTVVGKL